MSTPPKILVTSAAGHIGQHAVRLLIDNGYQVRAFVRRDDWRSQALAKLGAQVHIGNLYDFRDLSEAMKGVQRVFHIPPFAPHLLHNTMLTCLAAQDAGVEAMVLLSGWNPNPSHPSLLTREHWIANNVARWMPDVDVIHLTPGIFAFTYLMTIPVTRRLGTLPLPFGDGKNAPVSERDIARSAVALIGEPRKYAGTTWRPTGPKLLSSSDVAEVLGNVLGRRVKHQPISFKMFTKAARVMGAAQFDMYNLQHYAEEIQQGAFAIGAPTDHVAQLTGSPAESFAETAAHYATDVRNLAPNLRDLSTFGALRFMAKMMLTPVPDFKALAASEGSTLLTDPKPGHKNPAWQAAAKTGRLTFLGECAPEPTAALPRAAQKS